MDCRIPAAIREIPNENQTPVERQLSSVKMQIKQGKSVSRGAVSSRGGKNRLPFPWDHTEPTQPWERKCWKTNPCCLEGLDGEESWKMRALSTGSSPPCLELYPELQSVGAAPCADGAHPRASRSAHSTPTGHGGRATGRATGRAMGRAGHLSKVTSPQPKEAPQVELLIPVDTFLTQECSRAHS